MHLPVPILLGAHLGRRVAGLAHYTTEIDVGPIKVGYISYLFPKVLTVAIEVLYQRVLEVVGGQ